MHSSSFWNGVSLHSFLFKSVHVTTPIELVAVCLVTAALAFTFEGTRTLRDWLYMEFLRKRSCHSTSGRDTPMALHEVKQVKENQSSNAVTTVGDQNENSNASLASSVTPVIATGTISGTGKDCKKPASFQIGLLELSSSTGLHMVQVALGYLLMLVVMTFNVWMFVSVLVGTTVGFFVFDGFNKKIHALKVNSSLSK